MGRVVAGSDGLVMNLTGTAVVNRPRELAQQLITLGVLAGKGTQVQPWHLFGEEGAFLFRYCGPQESAFGWSFAGASNTAELHHRLRAWGLLLRRGLDATDLPPFRLEVLPIPAEDLDQAALAEYREVERAAADDFAGQARELAREMGVGVGDPRVRAAMAGSTGEHLVRLNELRQVLGRAKRPVVVAAHHRVVVDALAGEFGGCRIQGGQSAVVKEVHKARFQSDPVAVTPVIVVSVGAGGVGHTLTAARLGVQAELCWTPGELNQMAKRIHRIGQCRAVTYTVAVAQGTIDESMWAMITGKQGVLDAVLDGAVPGPAGEAAGDEATAAAAVVWELTRAGLDRIDGAGCTGHP